MTKLSDIPEEHTRLRELLQSVEACKRGHKPPEGHGDKREMTRLAELGMVERRATGPRYKTSAYHCTAYGRACLADMEAEENDD